MNIEIPTAESRTGLTRRSHPGPLVVIGAGHAGGRAAVRLREAGYAEQIIVLGEEEDPPYERPPLSKDVLSAGLDPLSGQLYSREFYRQQSIDLRLGDAVQAIDVEARRIHTRASYVDYGMLIIATGSRARVLGEVDVSMPGVHSLRSAADARSFRSQLLAGRHLLVLGGGFIGLEVAASARQRGCEVTVWESQQRLVQRGFDAESARLLASRHARRGVNIRCGVSLERLERFSAELLATASDGSRVSADLVIFGVGAVANDELARVAGIKCNDGILVDDYCRTSAAAVYAIGDVANQHCEFYGRRLRLESWENAEHQAQAVTDSIMGRVPKSIDVPWFWTDQYEDNWQLLGRTADARQCVTRGDPESDRTMTIAMNDGHVVGAVMLNMPRARRPLQQLIKSRAQVDPRKLADLNTPLESLN